MPKRSTITGRSLVGHDGGERTIFSGSSRQQNSEIQGRSAVSRPLPALRALESDHAKTSRGAGIDTSAN